MDEVFRALADPSRRALLDALHARGGQSLRELREGLAMTRQAVAKHLAVLEEAGLVVTSRHGREKHHHLNAAPINDVADRWIRRYDRARAQTLADLKSALEATEVSDDFVYVTYIRTTPEELWRALTDAAFITRYFDGGGPRSDWRVGSPVLWSMFGEEPHDWDQQVLEADPPRRLSYTWHTYQPEMQEMFGWSDERLAELQQEKRSKVTFEIEEAGGAVKLTVTHDDFVPGSEMKKGVEQGWPGILSNLKSVLETGEPVATR
ncbi:metalloregulator ArsR/SmtB family transcription factor [Actinomycetospora chlora]|uniref:Metalloregulator ArsR/SmtB family transcription factor n=1 Tax=Actinomycetospora chlora TaxID=663608 RepID=A0ABP9A4H9_9PSEU